MQSALCIAAAAVESLCVLKIPSYVLKNSVLYDRFHIIAYA